MFNLADACVQLEQSNTIDYTKITTEITSKTSSSSRSKDDKKEDADEFLKQKALAKTGDFFVKNIKTRGCISSDNLAEKIKERALENGKDP